MSLATSRSATPNLHEEGVDEQPWREAHQKEEQVHPRFGQHSFSLGGSPPGRSEHHIDQPVAAADPLPRFLPQQPALISNHRLHLFSLTLSLSLRVHLSLPLVSLCPGMSAIIPTSLLLIFRILLQTTASEGGRLGVFFVLLALALRGDLFIGRRTYLYVILLLRLVVVFVIVPLILLIIITLRLSLLSDGLPELRPLGGR